MAVTMVTPLPWQPLESILNNLKPLSETNKENLSKALFCGWKSLEGGLSQPFSHRALLPLLLSFLKLISFTHSLRSFPYFLLLQGLALPFSWPALETLLRACEGLRSSMQSHASNDNQRQSKLPDHPFYRACCLPLRLGACSSLSAQSGYYWTVLQERKRRLC